MNNKTSKAKTPAKKKTTKPKAKKVERTITVTKKQKSVSHFLQENGITQDQALHILQATPDEYKYTRPAKGGGTWTYVTGGYIKQVLNFTFGFNWDFIIDKQEEKYNQVITLGRLVVKDGKGGSVTKMQIGRADIKMKKGTSTPLDYGNDCKASATDSLKKCASEMGIAGDVYKSNEYVQQKNEVTEVSEEVEAYTVAKNLIATAKSKATLEAIKLQLDANDINFTVAEKKELLQEVDDKIAEYGKEKE